MDIRLKDLLYIIRPNTILVVWERDEGGLLIKTKCKIEETPIYKQIYANYSVLEVRPEDFGNGITYLFVEIAKE